MTKHIHEAPKGQTYTAGELAAILSGYPETSRVQVGVRVRSGEPFRVVVNGEAIGERPEAVCYGTEPPLPVDLGDAEPLPGAGTADHPGEGPRSLYGAPTADKLTDPDERNPFGVVQANPVEEFRDWAATLPEYASAREARVNGHTLYRTPDGSVVRLQGDDRLGRAHLGEHRGDDGTDVHPLDGAPTMVVEGERRGEFVVERGKWRHRPFRKLNDGPQA